MRVDDEMSLEMSQQRELATGARGSDVRSCNDSAEKTPPIPLTGQSAKGGIGRAVPADHEVPGQQRQQQSQESEVADVRRETVERRLARTTKCPPRWNTATEHDASDNVQTAA